MSIKLRGGTWHCDFVAPDGSRVRRSLETSDKRQAQELHDRLKAEVKWHTEFGHLNRGDMLTSEQHRCSNEKKKF
ncbi:hypothetical protein ACVOAK_22450, partial [Shigella flexneri]